MLNVCLIARFGAFSEWGFKLLVHEALTCLIARFGAFSEWGLKLLVYEALTCLIARFGACSEAYRMLCFRLMGP